MRRKVLQSVTAVLLSASMLLEGAVFAQAVPVSGMGQAETEAITGVVLTDADSQETAEALPAEEKLSAETVSGNEQPTTPTVPTVGKPGSIAASLSDEKTIKLTWSAVTGASGYEVYSNTNDKGFTRLWTFDGNVTSMDVLATLDQKALNIASTYSFKVRAFIKQDGKDYYGDFSDASASVKPTRAANEWLFASQPKSYKSVTLSWKPAGGVSGYKVLMATSKNGKYSVLKTVKSPGTVVSKDLSGKALSLAKKYYFKVQAYVDDNGKEYVSSESSAVKAKTKLAKPEINYLSANASDFVTVKWTKVKGATGYVVYRSKSKKKVGTVIAGGKKKSAQNKTTKLTKRNYIDKEAVPGQKYWYRVRAYKTINGKRYYSDYDLWPTAAATVMGSTSFVAAGCVCEKPNFVKLTWTGVKHAKGYFIQRSLSQSSGFSTVATVEGGNITATEIAQPNGTKYYYQIVCFNDKSKKKSWSYPCDPILMTSNYFCYPSENYQERCQRVFGQDHYYAYGTQAEADSRMADVSFEKWSVDPKKTAAGYTVKKASSFKVNKKVQPTVQQIINEIQAAQIQGVNLKIEEASGYNFTSRFQEEREGVTVTVKVVGGMPGTAAYNAVADIMAKYGYNKVSTYNQEYDPFRYVYVGLH
ncbi:MAG: hypothetical protein K6E75_14060 [Lachnospiraceae bacterium]|nr:hypothetical protein [Lachnospiraceae bacterium]